MKSKKIWYKFGVSKNFWLKNSWVRQILGERFFLQVWKKKPPIFYLFLLYDQPFLRYSPQILISSSPHINVEACEVTVLCDLRFSSNRVTKCKTPIFDAFILGDALCMRDKKKLRTPSGPTSCSCKIWERSVQRFPCSTPYEKCAFGGGGPRRPAAKDQNQYSSHFSNGRYNYNYNHTGFVILQLQLNYNYFYFPSSYL